jgi:hypothetical protein
LCAPGVTQKRDDSETNFVVVNMLGFSYEIGRRPDSVNRASREVNEVIRTDNATDRSNSSVDIVPDSGADASDSPCFAKSLPDNIDMHRPLDIRHFSDSNGNLVNAAGIRRIEPTRETLNLRNPILCCP